MMDPIEPEAIRGTSELTGDSSGSDIVRFINDEG